MKLGDIAVLEFEDVLHPEKGAIRSLPLRKLPREEKYDTFFVFPTGTGFVTSWTLYDITAHLKSVWTASRRLPYAHISKNRDEAPLEELNSVYQTA